MGLEVGTAISIISTVAGVVGSIAQGNQAAAADRYQAQIARNNALSAEYAAQDAKRRGEIAATNEALKTRQQIGTQRTAIAGGGIDVGSATAVDTVGDTARVGTLDIATIRSNAAREAYAYRQQGSGFTANANLYDSKAGNDQTAGYFNASATALNGFGSVASKWYTVRPSTPTDPSRTVGALSRSASVGGGFY